MTNSSDLTTDRLNGLLRELASRKPIKQALIALERGDHSFQWAGAIGEASDGEQVQPDTPFFIASIDKLYNATITMLLIESSRLELDASISTYLPNAVTRGLHMLGGVDYSDQITVRHLLSHTSGLADWLEDYPKGGPSLFERVIEEGDMALSIEDLAVVVRDELKPHFPPQDPLASGSKVRYSDTNFMLIAAIIEAVTGQPLHQVHEQLLLEPLDLRHTYFAGQSQPLDPTPAAMILRANGQPVQLPRLMCSIRGMYSTAADTIAFLRAFIQNEIFQDTETLAAMQAHWQRFGFPLDRAALRSPGWPIEYGLGIMRFQMPRLFSPRHPMPAVLGHTGSTGCWLFYCPELDMLLSGSVDEATAGAVPYRIVPKILNILRSPK